MCQLPDFTYNLTNKTCWQLLPLNLTSLLVTVCLGHKFLSTCEIIPQQYHTVVAQPTCICVRVWVVCARLHATETIVTTSCRQFERDNNFLARYTVHHYRNNYHRQHYSDNGGGGGGEYSNANGFRCHRRCSSSSKRRRRRAFLIYCYYYFRQLRQPV